jgi:hypothetical protein
MKLADGAAVKGLAIKSYNQEKKLWGWKFVGNQTETSYSNLKSSNPIQQSIARPTGNLREFN